MAESVEGFERGAPGQNLELAALHGLSLALSRSYDPDEILASGIELLLRVLDLPAGNVHQVLWDEGRLRLRISRGLSPEAIACLQEIPLEGTYAGEAARTSRTVIVRDVTEAARLPLHRDLFDRERFRGLACVPIVVNDRVWGVLAVTGKEARTCSPAQIQLLEAVSGQFGMALERAFLISELAGSNTQLRAHLEAAEAGKRRLETLTRVARSVTTTLNPQEVFQAVAQAVVDLFPGNRCSLWVAHGESLECRAEVGTLAPMDPMPTFRFGEGLVGVVAATREPLFIADVREDARVADPAWTKREGFVSYLGLPLIAGDRVQGVFDLFVRSAHRFSPEEVILLESFAGQAVVAIDNARLFQEKLKHAARVEALVQLNQAMSASLRPDQVLEKVRQAAVRLFNAFRVAIWISDEASRVLSLWRPPRSDSLDQPIPAQRHFGDGGVGWVAEHREPILFAPLETDERLSPEDRAHNQDFSCFTAIPIMLDSRLVGILSFTTTEAREVAPEDRALVGSLAGQAAIALENARLYEAERIRQEQLDAVRKVGQEVSTELELEPLLHLIVRRAVELTGRNSGIVYTLEDQVLVPRAWWNLGPWLSQVRFSLGQGIPGIVAQSGQAMIVNDYLQSPYLHPLFQEHSTVTALVAMPLISKGKVVGVITINNAETDRRFTEADQAILSLFAPQAASAIENARLYEQAQKRTRELQGLIRAGRAVASLEQKEVLEAVVREAALVMGVEGCNLRLPNPAAGQTAWIAYVGLPAEWANEVHFSIGEGLPGWVTTHGRPLAVVDPASDPRTRRPDCWKRFGFASYLGVPVKEDERTVGVLNLYTRTPHEFSEEEIALACSFADQAAITIKNVRLFEAAVSRTRELSALYAVASAAGQSLKLNEILDRALERALEVLEFEAGQIFLVEGEEARLAAFRGLPEEFVSTTTRVKIGAGLAGRTIQSGTPLWFEDVTTDPEYPRLAQQHVAQTLGFRAQILVPILLSGTPIGAVSLLHRAPHRFSPEEVRLLSAIAQQLAVAINNARLFEETQRAYEELGAAQERLVQVEKLRAMGEMASGVAHDFNNVLAAILGRAQLLLQRVKDPDLRRSLTVIEQAALDGAQTVRRIQEFTRVRREQLFTSVDMVQVIRDVVEVTQPRWQDELQSKGIVIRVETKLSPLPPVPGSPAELREVLTNLILNALDAMPNGGTLTLTSWAEERGVVIEVQDTGVGMSDEIRRRVFDPFFTTKGPQGTGLGLAMVYGIVTRHGGEMQVESREGIGSTFTIRLPYGLIESSPAPKKESAPVAPVRVLVIDDEEAVREALRDVLGLRHVVEEAASGEDGIDRLKRTRFDLVFTDLGMPGMSGWQVAQAVKALHPETAVVLVTGWGVQLDQAELRVKGVDRVLAKPFTMTEVLELTAALVHANGMEGK